MANNQYYLGETEHQAHLDVWKAKEKSVIKCQEAKKLSDVKLAEYEKKRWIDAYEEESNEERKLSKIEDVIVNAEGDIMMMTKNTIIKSEPRRGTNFKYRDSNVVYKAVDSIDEGVLAIKIWILDNEKNVYLNLKKIKEGRYILKKFAASGARIYACNERKEKEYAVKIAQFMLEFANSIQYVPYEYGWYKNHKNDLKFCEKNCMKELLSYAE